ncbi:MAG: sugar-binding protein [Lachnospiraceae bacterium]|nr:sugar-binding protein [Lachnospiraceae bacterium]
MKKKLLGAVLSVAMVATLLAGCGGSTAEAPAAAPAAPAAEAAPAEEKAEEEAPAEEAEEAPAEEAAAGGGLVGVAMPTKDLQRWNQDGSNMEAELKAAGYEVDLQFASNDVSTQVSQIENMINGGCQCLVVAAIDSESLGDVLAKAKEANIPVISYDRLIMNTDAITYYATFDNYKVGTVQGEYVRDTLDLDNADGPFNIEFTAGDPGDNNAGFFFNGAYDVLKQYIDDGKLVVKSGQKTFEEVATAAWATETAQSRAENILSSFYTSENLDVWLCSNDSTALGVENALAANYTGEYPIVTGQDCDVANVKNMLAGKQAMSVFKDTRTLASKTVEMVDAVMKGTEAPINDTETYDNGTGVIPSFLCDPVFADANNYKEILIDSGYYAESDLQ